MRKISTVSYAHSQVVSKNGCFSFNESIEPLLSAQFSSPHDGSVWYRLAVTNNTKKTNKFLSQNVDIFIWPMAILFPKIAAQNSFDKFWISLNIENIIRISRRKCWLIHSLIFYYGSKHGSESFSLMFPFLRVNILPVKTAICAEKRWISTRNPVFF